MLPLRGPIQNRSRTMPPFPLRGVLDIPLRQNDRNKGPWMVMERPVFIAPAKAVKVDA